MPRLQDPDLEALYQHALALHGAGELTKAADLYRAMLAQLPDHPLALAGLGTVALQTGNVNEGIDQLQRSLQVAPMQPITQANLGIALWTCARASEALACFDRAISLQPAYAEAHGFRGVVLHAINRPEEALASLDRSIALNPENAEMHSHRGVVLHDLHRLGEALESLERAIALNPTYTEAYNNRGNVFKSLRGLNEAQVAFKPAHAEDHISMRSALRDGSLLQKALADYDRALALTPDYAPAHWNKALVRLLLGDYEEGWKHYEWRWKDWEKDFMRPFPQPLWLGDAPIAGKTLLIHAEQGFGDFIQCCRYIPMAEALGAKVVVEVFAPLVPLLSSLKGSFSVVPSGQPLPHFDLHCPIMSLPLAFKTAVETIPASVPYLFADPGRLQLWRQRLGPRTRMRVGLVWAGNPAHKNDLNRSIPFRLLARLPELPVEFHILQKDIRPQDAGEIAKFANVRVHSAELGDFADTAALAQEMDLVISADTSVAHLAGAMGRPLWLLLPFNPDYRWFLDRADSPWYPTATLFRQPAIGDWGAVISDVAARLDSVARDVNAHLNQ